MPGRTTQPAGSPVSAVGGVHLKERSIEDRKGPRVVDRAPFPGAAQPTTGTRAASASLLAVPAAARSPTDASDGRAGPPTVSPQSTGTSGPASATGSTRAARAAGTPQRLVVLECDVIERKCASVVNRAAECSPSSTPGAAGSAFRTVPSVSGVPALAP
ncbi:MAG TPA: hypothetical protein VFG07_05840 [Thermoplasmata archaeon]|nr:hypothetical protein [Thermoplasmata archaeon]